MPNLKTNSAPRGHLVFVDLQWFVVYLLAPLQGFTACDITDGRGEQTFDHTHQRCYFKAYDITFRDRSCLCTWQATSVSYKVTYLTAIKKKILQLPNV